MNAIGPYKILRKLGEGGMGIVYQAEDPLLHRQVAVKLIHQHLINDESLSSRFLTEARLTASLLHANIATLYNLTEHEGQLAMVMEYIEGITLEELLKRGNPLEEGLATGILMQVLDGLGFAHERGIVHRDVKPSNIMITRTGQVKIMDFGIAHQQGTSRLTQTGKMVGTLHYMAPEQILGKEAVTQSDMYAAGIVLYEMLTGDPPFAGKSDFTLMEAQIKTTPSMQFPALRGKVARVIQQALRKKPEQRYTHTGEFTQALRSVAEPYDAAMIRKAVFEPGQQQETPRVPATARTLSGGQVTETGRAITGKLNALPVWLPKVLFAAAGIALLVMVVLMLLPNNSDPTNAHAALHNESELPGESDAGIVSIARNQSPQQETSRTELIASYLSKARGLYREQKFLPPGENAVYYCNEILAIDPGHAEAQQMKIDISRHYEEAGDKAVRQKDDGKALEQYKFALAAYSPDGDISGKIEDIERRMALANSKSSTSSRTSSTPGKPAPAKSSREGEAENRSTSSAQNTQTGSGPDTRPPQESSSTTGKPTQNENKKSTETPPNRSTQEAQSRGSLTRVEIPKNTKMIVQLSQTVNSETVSEGQRVRFVCPQGLTVNGIRVIDAGTEASGTVTNLRQSGGQRSARLEVSMEATRSVTGESVPLYGVFMDIAKGKTGVEFRQGTRFEVSTRNYLVINGYK